MVDNSAAGGTGPNPLAVYRVGAGGCASSPSVVSGASPVQVGAFNDYLPGFDTSGCGSGGSFTEYGESNSDGIALNSRDWTIEMWVRAPTYPSNGASPPNAGDSPHDISASPILFEQCPNGAANNMECLIIQKGNGSNDGKLLVFFDGASGDTGTTCVAGNSACDGGLTSTNSAGTNAGLDDGNWHYVVVTFTASTAARQIYIDGEEAGNDTTSESYLGAASCVSVDEMGACGNGTSSSQDIDDVRVTQTALDWATVRTRYYGSHHYVEAAGNADLPPVAFGESGSYTAPSGTQNTWGSGSNPHIFSPAADSCSNGTKNPVSVLLTVGTANTAGSTSLFNATATDDISVRTVDLTDNFCKDDFSINYDPSYVDTPPAPVAAVVTTSSVTWSWGPAATGAQYDCDTNQTDYLIAQTGASVNSVTCPGGNGCGTSKVYSSYPANAVGNEDYCITVTASYTDSCVGGSAIQSAATSQTCACTLANTPTAGPSFWGAGAYFPNGSYINGTSVNLQLGATGANSSGTGIDVEGSVNGGSSFQQLTAYDPVPPSTVTVSNLQTSQTYQFAERAENCNNFKTVDSPVGATFITQPTAPTGFVGTPAPYPTGCGKTQVYFTWNTVTTGSGDAAQYYLFPQGGGAALYSGSANSALYTVPGSPSLSGTSVSAYVMSYDPGATVWHYSFASSTITASTVSDVIPAPQSLLGTPVSAGIDWTWNAPPYLCSNWTYQVVDQYTGAQTNMPANSSAQYLEVPMTANTIDSIAVRVQDAASVGFSALSSAATAYSAANPPVSLTAVTVATGTVALSWGANGNPSYTRYDVGYSANGVNVSSPITISSDYTQTIATITALSPGTSYFFTVRAFNGRAGDAYGNVPSATTEVELMTLAQAPLLTGTTVSATSLQWQWTQTSGSTFYRLFATPPGAQIGADQPQSAGPNYTITQNGLSANTQVAAYVAAYNGQGLPETSTTFYLYTNSDDPTGPQWAGVSSRTVSVSWNANGNSANTIYIVDITTDAAFGFVTLSQGAVGTSGTFGPLFPATTYYARVRSTSGSGYEGNEQVIAVSTITNPDPDITLSSSPANSYLPSGDVVGLWHFDVNEGTWTPDASIYGNGADLVCLSNGCTSTPTFVAGMPTLSSAVSLSGATSSLILVPDAPQYQFTGALTVAAWVDVAQRFQEPDAGIIARSSWTGTDFWLGISGNNYAFYAGGTLLTSHAAVAPSQWTRVAGVYDPTGNQLRLYINGALDSSVTGVGARSLEQGWNLAIGNRVCAPPFTGSCAGGGASNEQGQYNGGLIGTIDEVHFLAQAFQASDALADYQGAFPSTITLPSPNNGVSLYVPPDAFGGPAVIYVSRDPINHPIEVDQSTLQAGLSQEPTGQILIPGTLTEIVPTVNGQPFEGPLLSSASISMAYSDPSNSGLVQGVSPSVAAKTLTIYTLNTSVDTWTQLPSTVDLVGHQVTATTPHFSIFAMFGSASIAQTLQSVRVYPDPWTRGTNDRYDATELTFDNLPQEGTIRILDLSGQRVVDLPFSGSNAGKVLWDGNNSAGHAAASGVYFAYIKSDLVGTTTILKFAIER